MSGSLSRALPRLAAAAGLALTLACGGGGGGTTDGGGSSNPPPANLPTVASSVPPFALPGQVVILTGTNFTGATAVKFGSVAATSFAVVDATHVRAVVPAGAATGALVITAPAGSGPGFTFTIPTRTYTGSFTATGSLLQGRYNHQALVLPSGKVLALGGNYNTGPNAATWTGLSELYDPATGTWTATGTMPNSGRSGTFNAQLLTNGKVLATGNDFNFAGIDTADLYDPASGTWSKSGVSLTKRWAFPTVLLSDGRVLAIGGMVESGPYTATCEIYDPATGTWSATGSMGVQRRSAVALLLPDGRVLAAGGMNAAGGDLTSSEYYDPATGTWSPGPTLPMSRFTQAFLAPDGKVLLARGGDFIRLDVATGTATATSDPMGNTVDRTWAGRILLPGGKLLMAGGRNRNANNDLPSCELFDPAAGTYAPTGDQTTAREGALSLLLPDGSVVHVGGFAYGSTGAGTPGTCDVYR